MNSDRMVKDHTWNADSLRAMYGHVWLNISTFTAVYPCAGMLSEHLALKDLGMKVFCALAMDTNASLQGPNTDTPDNILCKICVSGYIMLLHLF